MTAALSRPPAPPARAPGGRAKAWRLPGLGLSLGFTLTYLGLIVLIPLAALVIRTTELGWDGFWSIVTGSRTLNALKLSFGIAFVAALVNAVFGLVVAWVLVRYRLPGRRVLDALIDIPFALPTAVAGVALVTLYARNGWLGQHLEAWGIQVAFTPIGIAIALIFVGMPFVIRTVQPVLEDMEREQEEAARTLGASDGQTARRVVLPQVLPALLTGFALALARGVGEYGSVIFIAGNIPHVSEIAPLLIVIRLEEFDYAGATALATAMLLIAFALLLAINLLQGWSRRRLGHAI